MGRPARARHARGGRAGGRPGGPRLRGPRGEASRNGSVHDAREDRRRPLQAKALPSTRAGPAGPGAGLEDELDPAVRREAIGVPPLPLSNAALNQVLPQTSLVSSKSWLGAAKAILPLQGERGVGGVRRREVEPLSACVARACACVRGWVCVRACVCECACVCACARARVCACVLRVRVWVLAGCSLARAIPCFLSARTSKRHLRARANEDHEPPPPTESPPPGDAHAHTLTRACARTHVETGRALSFTHAVHHTSRSIDFALCSLR